MREIALLLIAGLTLNLASCDLRRGQSGRSGSTLDGADADELRKMHSDPSPEYAKLYRKDPTTGEDVVKVVIVAHPYVSNNDDTSTEANPRVITRDHDHASRQIRTLRDWLIGKNGYTALLPDAQEVVHEALDSNYQTINGPAQVANDRIDIISARGPRLGGETGTARWELALFVAAESSPDMKSLERVARDASIVIMNQADWISFPTDLVATSPYQIVASMHCISERTDEVAYLRLAKERGFDLQLLTSRSWVHYGEIARLDAIILKELTSRSSYATMLEKLPGTIVFRSLAIGTDLDPSPSPSSTAF